MSDSSLLLSEYQRLRAQTNAQRRGYELQALVGSMLGQRHFKVETKSKAARPRQVDLFATRGDTVYLIETKWRKDKANSDDIDSLYTRLEAVPSHVTGLMVSHEGFTQEVMDRVREKSARPVVLLTGKELEAALQWDGDIVGLLRRKKNALLVNRQVLVDVEARRASGGRPARRGSSGSSDLPSSDLIFVFPDGRRSRWMACSGEFGRFTFVPELEDIDWVSGGGLGVTLDVQLPAQDQREFFDLLRQLATMGWVTPKGCWSIQQATANWHGFGADALLEALDGWKHRYEGLETHHTEELCYVDECEDGFFSIVAQIAADRRRTVWRVELSFQLRGVPLDPGPYRELCDHFGLSQPVYFRPRSEPSRRAGRPKGKRPVVRPIAYVVNLEKQVRDQEDDEWVAGIVVESPWAAKADRRSARVPKWVPDVLAESEYLVCALRSWHTLARQKAVYELWAFESAWTSDALVVEATADWQSDLDELDAELCVVEEPPLPGSVIEVADYQDS